MVFASLQPGELLFSDALRQPGRVRPPNKEKGLGVWDMVYFFVLFPLSRTAFIALHGWALERRRARGPAAFAASLPACGALLLLQLASTMLGVVITFAFGVFASLCVMSHRT